jgi:hypothetical protein
MKVEEILGKREDQRLEFKSAKVLAEKPESVARAVVGMLNAEGGTIWIGIEDDKEGAAGGMDPVTNVEREKGRLLDYLLETIEPAPIKGEVVIEVQPLGGGESGLLAIRIQPPTVDSGRLPAAFLRKGGRHYLRRFGARNHPMSRQEVFGNTSFGTGDQAIESAMQKLLVVRQSLQEAGASGLWSALRPVRTLQLDLQDPLFERIPLDPSETGNRRGGWHFASSREELHFMNDHVRWVATFGLTGEPTTRVDVNEDGELSFLAELSRLHWKGEANELWPYALLEHPISAVRIARRIYRDHLANEDLVAADLALLGIAGWTLRGGTPTEASVYAYKPAVQEEPDLVWDPVIFTFGEIDEAPDRCGFRLVRRIYQAFGLREEAIPRDYDRESGRLILPE